MAPLHSKLVDVDKAFKKAISKKFDYDNFWLEYDLSIMRRTRMKLAGIDGEDRIMADPHRILRDDHPTAISASYRTVIIHQETTVYEFLHSTPPEKTGRPGSIDDAVDFIARFPLVAMQHTLVVLNTMVFDPETDMFAMVGIDAKPRGGFVARILERKRLLLINDLLLTRK
ncbi:MAG TPA: hypothetical protein VFT82_04475 [Candidatus Paceibacterota bacterium]|nr:hypothetical protein [Candidatus Paceibacterota bacterium]